MSPKRTIHKMKVNRNPGRTNPLREETNPLREEELHKLELPEMLDSIDLKLDDAVYIDPKQQHSTMGQIRLMEWIAKHKSAPTAMAKTETVFHHIKKGPETSTRKLRTTVRFASRAHAIDIYLLEGNSNLVLGSNFLRDADLRKEGEVLRGLEGEKDIHLQQNTKGPYIIPREVQIVYHLDEAADRGKQPVTTLAHLHKYFGHPSAESLYRLVQHSSMKSSVAEINKIVEQCEVCIKKRKKIPRKKVGMQRSTAFNQVVSMDLKVHTDCYILWMVDEATRFIKGQVILNKRPETIIEAMNKLWINGDGAGPGMPEKYFYTDNGREFVNELMLDLLDAHDISLKTTAAYTPNQNGLNERNHGLADIVVTSLMEDDPNLKMQEAVNHAAFVRNSSINDTGFSPFQLVYGRNPRIPGTVENNHPLSLNADTRNETARTMIARNEATRRKFLEKESDRRIKRAAAERVTFRDDHTYESGEIVWFRDSKDDERRKGTIIGRDGPNWCIKWNGHVRTVAPYDMWKVIEQRNITEEGAGEAEEEPDPVGTQQSQHAQETPEPPEEPQEQAPEPMEESGDEEEEEETVEEEEQEDAGKPPKEKQKKKERRQHKVQGTGKEGVQPRRYAHVSCTNLDNETFTGTVVKNVTNQGEKIVWIKLHEGNTLAPIAWDKLLSWKYITGKDADATRELMQRWAEFENKRKQPYGTATQLPPADGGLADRWKQYEERLGQTRLDQNWSSGSTGSCGSKRKGLNGTATQDTPADGGLGDRWKRYEERQRRRDQTKLDQNWSSGSTGSTRIQPVRLRRVDQTELDQNWSSGSTGSTRIQPVRLRRVW